MTCRVAAQLKTLNILKPLLPPKKLSKSFFVHVVFVWSELLKFGLIIFEEFIITIKCFAYQRTLASQVAGLGRGEREESGEQ